MLDGESFGSFHIGDGAGKFKGAMNDATGEVEFLCCLFEKAFCLFVQNDIPVYLFRAESGIRKNIRSCVSFLLSVPSFHDAFAKRGRTLTMSLFK